MVDQKRPPRPSVVLERFDCLAQQNLRLSDALVDLLNSCAGVDLLTQTGAEQWLQLVVDFRCCGDDRRPR